MTFRVLVLVVGAAWLAAVPARAQKRGSVEVGAFTAYMNADNSLPVGNAIGFGGRVGVNAMPWLSFEVDLAHASKNGATHSPLHVWLVYNVPPTSRVELFAGVGYVHNKYSGSYVATDNGIGGLVGVRQRFGKMLAIRLDGHADFIPSSANKSYLISYNGNWGVGIGVSALLNR
jgi:outer membrane protein with beta-barrel domain